MYNSSSSSNYRGKRSKLCKEDSGLKPRCIENSVAFPLFSKPQPVGFFSLNTQRLYEQNDKQLKYYRPPSESEYPLDLNLGFEKAITKPPSVGDERLDHLFQFICDHEAHLFTKSSNPRRLAADFACWRGLLRLIMCTPYEFRQDWCINITRFKETCYMVQRETEFRKKQRENETTEQKKFFSYGFKFEQYCLTDEPFGKPNINAPVDECAEFSGVFHVKLENMLLLFGAEIDGVLSDTSLKLESASDMEKLHFVELKVQQGINQHPQQKEFFHRQKSRVWWCQSFLVGITDLFVGLRDEHGFVHKIERTAVRNLPKQAKGWSPSVCANFLVQFLRCVRHLMINVDCPHTVYEFYYNARNGRITYEIFNGKTEHSFLPDWYLNKF